MLVDKIPNTSIIINEIEHLYFSGTSYLGISTNIEFQHQLIKSIQKWGTSYGSSRNANIKLYIYKEAEDFLANFLQKEEAVTVSSGTLAGQLALKTLKEKVSIFFYMPKTHPAILPENSFPIFVEGHLNTKLLNSKNKTICIVSDAIAALETTPFSFDFLKSIPESTKIKLLVDESHSLGVLEKNGQGISLTISVKKNIEIVVVSSLGKAFGINGGVIAGKSAFINLIKKDSLFIGSAGMNPAFLDCFLNSKEIYKKQLKALQKNCKYVFDNIHDLDKIRISKNYPVFFIDDEKIANFLSSNKIVITSFYYPPSEKKINRIVINANHTKEQLDALINLILTFLKK